MKRMMRNWVCGTLVMVVWLCLQGMAVQAQAPSYERLWAKVDSLVRQDLPRSVLKAVEEIAARAEAERNVPQLMKAYLTRSACRVQLTPDSLSAERKALTAWAEQETDVVAKAVLYNVLGGQWLDGTEKDVQQAVHYFRLSLQAKERLAETPAGNFRPMTVPGRLSERYFKDNLYDLLVRQAIRKLSSQAPWAERDKALEVCWDWYEELSAWYEGKGDRQAAFLTREAQLWFQLERMAHLRRYVLEKDEAERRLRSLVQAGEGLSVGADAAVKLAEWYLRQDEREKVVEVAQEALRRFPKGEWADRLHRYVRAAVRPELQARLPFVYPDRLADVHVRFANLTGVTFECYRLSLPPASPLLRGDLKEAELARRYGKKVSSASFSLVPRKDYRAADTVLQVQLPEAGVYLMKQVPKGHADKAAYTLLHLSPYQAVFVPVDARRMEVVAMDKLTGQPVAGAELVTYRYVGGEYQQQHVFPAGPDGSVVWELPDKGTVYYNVRTSGNDFMPVCARSARLRGTYQRQEGTELKGRLYTDRALYRPGQVVHVSGLLWRQNGDSLHVAAGERRQLSLVTEAGELARLEVVTDTMGVLQGELVLPSSLRPGTYTVRCQEAARTFRVEEYKRPTFGVEFQPYDAPYHFGDSVEVKAVARTFAGAPVQEAVVRYRVLRQERRWFRWGPVREEQVAAGVTRTDAEGRLCVPARLAEPEGLERENYVLYRLLAEVTNGAGETQESVMELPVARQSVGLQVKGLPEVWQKEQALDLQFQALNLKGRSVELSVGYQVEAVGDDGRPVAVALKGEAMSNRPVDTSAFQALAPGRYRLVLTVSDTEGEVSQVEREFVLFSGEDRRMPYTTDAWFHADGSVFGPGQEVTCYAGSSCQEVYLLVDVYCGTRRIESRRERMDNEVRAFRFAYRPEYGDGLLVSFAFVKEGVLYSHIQRIEKARPDQRLEVRWTSFRDRLQPGAQEEWQLKVTDPLGRPVAASLMATLYDASLDALVPHGWDLSLDLPRRIPYHQVESSWAGSMAYMGADFPFVRVDDGLQVVDGAYSRLFESVPWRRMDLVRPLLRANASVKSAVLSADAETASVAAAPRSWKQTGEEQVEEEAVMTDEDRGAEAPLPEGTLRSHLAETAFFYPCLRTDSSGRVSLTFTMPDALTRWRFLGLAHTASLQYGLCKAEAVTQKAFMVQPNWPRFFRRGDRATVAAAIVNLSSQPVAGTAFLELRDPETEQVVLRRTLPFDVAAGATTDVRFDCPVPQGHSLLVGRLLAEGGALADGEQQYVPVLTDQEWVTETVPFQLYDGETVTVRQKELFNRQSRTAQGHRLTLELTANPDWYAVQALPVLADPQTDDALAWATALYAQSVAAQIVETRPRLREQLAAWQGQGTTASEVASRLEQNPDLRQLLLAETPWVVEAAEESDRQRRIAVLLELNGLRDRQQRAVRRLKALQGADGAWSWFEGMAGSASVTLRVVELLARLQAMGVALDTDTRSLYERGLSFLRRDVAETVRRMQEQPAAQPLLSPQSEAVGYLYVCAIDSLAGRWADRAVNDWLCTRLENRSADFSIQEKARLAIVLQSAGRSEQAAVLIRSLQEHLVSAPGMGQYFDTGKAEYTFGSYRIPTHVAAMEALARLAPDETVLDAMKLWLLRQKQVQVWESPLATADAVHAFFCLGGQRPAEGGVLQATIGKERVETPAGAQGYVRRTLTGSAARRADIRVSRQGSGMGWGAVYAQYLEEQDKLQAHTLPELRVERTWFREGHPLDEGAALQVGDRVTVRLTVTAGRDMDFVQLTDSRPACMEPVEALSGYQWNGGTGCYRIVRDASTQFFFDHLRKGTHVLEYTVRIDRQGTYQAGTATVQSAYAPELAAHTAGRRWVVAP